MADIKLGVVGEAMLKKIKQQQKRLTSKQIEYLSAQGYVPRGTGYINNVTGKFVSDSEIQNVLKSMPSDESSNGDAEKVDPSKDNNNINGAVKQDADPVYNVVKSISESISQFVDLIIERPSKKDVTAKAQDGDNKGLETLQKDNSSFFGNIGKILAGLTLFGATLLMPLINILKSTYKTVVDFSTNAIKSIKESVTKFFTTTVSDFFEDIKDFFVVDVPHQLSKLVDVFNDAINSFLEVPGKIIDSIKDYGLTFAQNILDKFGPWLDMIGVNTKNAKTDIEARQKNLAKKEEAAAAQRKIDELDRQKELAERANREKQHEKEKRDLEESKRKERAARDQQLAQDAKDKKSAARPATKEPAPAAPKPAAPAPKPAPAAPKPAPAPAPASPQPKMQGGAKPSFESVTKKDKGVDTNNLNPVLKDRVAAMAAAYNEKTGQKLLITSGYRSNEEQTELWNAELARNGGNVKAARKKVAPPKPIGKGSRHQSGLAIDINSKGNGGLNVLAGDRTKSTGWIEQFGLSRPVADENWHVQLAGDAPSPDNPDNPGAPTIIPGSKKILSDGPLKDITAEYDAQTRKKGSSGSSTSSASSVAKDLVLPTRPIADALLAASKKVGVDLSILYAIAKQESGFDPSAKAGTSSGKGLFQFINGTWDSVFKSYKSFYPELSRGPLDPLANAIAGALYIKENMQILSKKKIPINATSVYAAHFLGPYGASKLLSSDVNAIAASLFRSAAKSNPNIFYDKANGNRARTIGEVIETLYGKVGQYAEKYAALMSPSMTAGIQVATATGAADIKPPKAVNVAQAATPQQVKTAAISNTKSSVPNIAAIVNTYKEYFSVA